MAKALFPNEHDAGTVMSKVVGGRAGVALARDWENKLCEVRDAMLVAFGHDPAKVYELEKEKGDE